MRQELRDFILASLQIGLQFSLQMGFVGGNSSFSKFANGSMPPEGDPTDFSCKPPLNTTIKNNKILVIEFAEGPHLEMIKNILRGTAENVEIVSSTLEELDKGPVPTGIKYVSVSIGSAISYDEINKKAGFPSGTVSPENINEYIDLIKKIVMEDDRFDSARKFFRVVDKLQKANPDIRFFVAEANKGLDGSREFNTFIIADAKYLTAVATNDAPSALSEVPDVNPNGEPGSASPWLFFQPPEYRTTALKIGGVPLECTLEPSSRPENIIGQALQDEQKNLNELKVKINSINELRLATEEDYKKIDTFNKETKVLKEEITHLQAQPHLDENSQRKLNEMQELLEQKVTKHDKEIDRVVFPLKEIQGLLSSDYLIIAQGYPYVVLSVSSFEYSLRETLKEIQSEQGSDAVTFTDSSLTDEIARVSARINELKKQQDVLQTHGTSVVISIGASGITPWVAAACAKNTVLQSESQFYDFYKNFCAKSN
ncbi:MAG: hypothetical protein ACK53X_03870 [Holosporales bacterium]